MQIKASRIRNEDLKLNQIYLNRIAIKGMMIIQQAYKRIVEQLQLPSNDRFLLHLFFLISNLLSSR